MIDFEKEFARPDYELGRKQVKIAATFRLVYGWMGAGLLLSGLVAWHTATSGLYQRILSSPAFYGCLFGELILVFVLSAAINKLPLLIAYAMFAGYAVLNGLTLSVIFLLYDLASIQRVFFITAGMFGGLAVWGSVTREDLSSVGSICGMALWGLILASLVNIFCGSSRLDWILSLVGVAVFSGLTMFDAQKIRQMAARESVLDTVTVHRVGIIGALALYLDFVNLFLYLLRLFGKRK